MAEARLGIGDESPVVLAKAERELSRRQMDLLGRVGGTRLQQTDLHLRVLAQPRRQHAPSRTCTDDHIVELAHPPILEMQALAVKTQVDTLSPCLRRARPGPQRVPADAAAARRPQLTGLGAGPPADA